MLTGLNLYLNTYDDENETQIYPILLIIKMLDQQQIFWVSSPHAHNWCFVMSEYVTDLCLWLWKQCIKLAGITFY